MSTPLNTTRRAAIAMSLAVIATTGIAVGQGTAQAKPAAASIEPSSHWLDGLTAKHRQFFDSPSPNGGVPLVHLMNYYDTYNKAFNVKDADIDAVLSFYGATTFYALNDAAWAKYRLGEFLDTNDPTTGKPATANPWRTSPVVLGMSLPQASLESLHGRGATLILCNNALQVFSMLLAGKRGLEVGAVYQDLKANILPEVQLVPGMVVAIEQAARAGLSYHRQ
jgi:hypothetical protein